MENENVNKSFWIKDSIFLTVLLWGAVPWVMLGVEVKDRTNSWIKALISSFFALILIVLIYGSVSDTNKNTRIDYLEDQLTKVENENKNLIKTSPDTTDIKNKDEKETEETDPTPTTKPEQKEHEFGAGNYTCGKDFEPGTYNLIAIEGSSGNVMTPGKLLGGLNEIMGLDESWATREINNIEFKNDDVLEIRGVKIKLVPSN